MARHLQLVSAAQGMPVEAGDDRFGKSFDPVEQVMHPLEGGFGGFRIRHARKLRHIRPGGEHLLPGPGQNDGADFPIPFDFVQDRTDFLQRIAAQGVHRRPVDGNHRHPLPDFKPTVFSPHFHPSILSC